MTFPMSCIAVMAALLVGLVTPGAAQDIPALSVLSSAVTASNPELASRRATLAQQRAALHGKVNSLNSQCASVVNGSAAATACLKTQAELSAQLNTHIQESKDFNAAAQTAVQTPIVPNLGDADTAKFCAAKLKVATDEQEIQQMNFGNDARSFEKFAALSSAERAKFKEKMRNAFLDQALEATTMAAKSAASLNPWSVNTKIDKLRAIGLSNDWMFTTLRKIAATKDKPAIARAYKELIDGVQKWKEVNDTKKDMEDDPKNADLRLTLGVLKIAGGAELGLFITAADFGESFRYLYYTSSSVDDLMEITDDKLALLKNRIDRLKTDVAALNKVKRDRTKSETSGEPDCRS
jgi:hypothetical protein